MDTDSDALLQQRNPRFSKEEDAMLLKVAMAQEPWTQNRNLDAWRGIADEVNASDVRLIQRDAVSCRNRFHYLLRRQRKRPPHDGGSGQQHDLGVGCDRLVDDIKFLIEAEKLAGPQDSPAKPSSSDPTSTPTDGPTTNGNNSTNGSDKHDRGEKKTAELMPAQQTKYLRFTVEEDEMILRMVSLHEPWAQKKGAEAWNTIVDQLNALDALQVERDPDSCRSRFYYLLRRHRTNTTRPPPGAQQSSLSSSSSTGNNGNENANQDNNNDNDQRSIIERLLDEVQAKMDGTWSRSGNTANGNTTKQTRQSTKQQSAAEVATEKSTSSKDQQRQPSSPLMGPDSSEDDGSADESANEDVISVSSSCSMRAVAPAERAMPLPPLTSASVVVRTPPRSSTATQPRKKPRRVPAPQPASAAQVHDTRAFASAMAEQEMREHEMRELAWREREREAVMCRQQGTMRHGGAEYGHPPIDYQARELSLRDRELELRREEVCIMRDQVQMMREQMHFQNEHMRRMYDMLAEAHAALAHGGLLPRAQPHPSGR